MNAAQELVTLFETVDGRCMAHDTVSTTVEEITASELSRAIDLMDELGLDPEHDGRGWPTQYEAAKKLADGIEEYSLTQFREYVKSGSYNDYDGSAGVVREGKETYPVSIQEVMELPLDDPAKIRWYNK